MTHRRHASPAVVLLPIALIVAACGGATTPSVGAAASGSGAVASSSAPSAAASQPSAPSQEPAASDAAPSAGTIPSFDLSALTGAIPGVDSYRTSFSIGGVEQYRSVVVTQPVLSKEISIVEDGAVTSRFIVIGKETWTADGADGAFEAVPEAMAGLMLLAFDPTMMLSAYANVDWGLAAVDQGAEQKNGVQARHIKIDPTTLAGLAAAMPAGSAIDIWIAEAGYIVAWEMSGFGADSDMSIQITGVDDPANTVQAPS